MSANYFYISAQNLAPNSRRATRTAGFTTPLKNVNANPGGLARFECSYQGFGPQPIVKWSFKPNNSTPVAIANAFMATTSQIDNNSLSASLEIPHVLFKHAGEYTVALTHPHTGETLKNSGGF